MRKQNARPPERRDRLTSTASHLQSQLIAVVAAGGFDDARRRVRDAAIGLEALPLVDRLFVAARAAWDVKSVAAVVDRLLGTSRALRADPAQFNCLVLSVHSRRAVTTLDVVPRHRADDDTSRIAGTIEETVFRHDAADETEVLVEAIDDPKSALRIATALVRRGLVDVTLTDFLSRQYGLPAVHLDDLDIAAEAVALVPKELALKHLVMPINTSGQSLILAMCDPSNIYAVDDLKFITGMNIEAVVASEPEVRDAIARHYGTDDLSDAAHFVAFASELESLCAEVSKRDAWRALAQKPFTFIGQWWVKGALRGSWTITGRQ